MQFLVRRMLVSAIRGMVFVFVLSGLVQAGELPGFDGGYVLTNEGDYLEIPASPAEEFYVGYMKGTFYGTLNPRILTVKSGNFRGILIKGKQKFSLFSLHYAGFGDGGNGRAYEKGVLAARLRVETRSRAEGDDSYYFEPRVPLLPGRYIAWIANTFWIFSLVE